VNAINLSAEAAVPVYRQNFFKFWWKQELDALKENSMESHKLWVSAGRHRFGPIFGNKSRDCHQVDGTVDPQQVADNFSNHF
jgi:hypothetical protein